MIDVDSKGLNKFFAWFSPVVPFSSVTTDIYEIIFTILHENIKFFGQTRIIS